MKHLCSLLCIFTASLSLIASNTIPHHHHNGVAVMTCCSDNHNDSDCNDHKCCNDIDKKGCKPCPLSATKISILKNSQNVFKDKSDIVYSVLGIGLYKDLIFIPEKHFEYFCGNEIYTPFYHISSLSLRAPPAII